MREFKAQKFRAALDNMSNQLRALRAQAGVVDASRVERLHPLEIEEGSSPVDLQRQFRDRVGYDYLGQRFLYFEPQGGLAWEGLIKAGYDQDRWLAGVEDCMSAWLNLGTASVKKGDLAEAERAFKKAQSLDPTDPRPKANLADLEALKKKSP